MNSFKKEIYNLSILSHPNIVPLVGVCEEKDCIWILMRKFDESLKGYIANSKEKFGFTENDIVFVSKELEVLEDSLRILWGSKSFISLNSAPSRAKLWNCI